MTPTVGVVNRHEVAIATDSLSIKATNILSPPIAPLTFAGLASHAAPPTKRWGWLMGPRISRGEGFGVDREELGYASTSSPNMARKNTMVGKK